MDLLFNTILVPQGAEYQSVYRGLNKIDSGSLPQVLPIPLGINGLTKSLTERNWQMQTQQNILVMGLCGSLSPQYQIGDIVLYRDCLFSSPSSLQKKHTDLPLTNTVNHLLHENISLVTALTSDRLIYSAQEKLNLGQRYQASVVDMEGFALLSFLQKLNSRVVMLRVVSDNARDDIPNLNRAIDSTGKLQTIPMAIAMVRQPLAATRLITGAIQGLKVLQKITINLFGD